MIPANVALPGDGADVVVGLRPQHLAVREGASAVTVDIRERLGGVAYDYLDTPTGERIVVETRGDEAIPEGSGVLVDFDPAEVMFFDAATEKRLR